MRHLLALLALLVAPLSSAAASVTDRYYRDQHLVSADGRLKLDAVSPDNAGDRPQPFADDFVYTLTDTASGRVIWQRQQPEDEGSPMRVFLDDTGYVVVYAAREDLLILDATTGRKSLELSLMDTFGEEECDKYVSWTTAGPMWWGTTHTYFASHEGLPQFVMRTWWDRRIVLDLVAGRAMERLPEAVVESCLSAERDWASRTLDQAAADPDRLGAIDWRERQRVHTAVHLAGCLGLTETVEDLRVLERLNDGESSVVIGGTPRATPDTELDTRNYSEIRLRQRVHLALRRIGETPAELGCVWFADSTGKSFYIPPTHDTPRETRVAQLTEGMSPKQVIDLLGCPDYVTHYRSEWEYDIDGANPRSIVLTLDKAWAQVDKVETITPPRWKEGRERDNQLNW